MLSRLKHLLIGTPLPTQQADFKRLNKTRALAAFSPAAISSLAYANQEIYLGLVVAGAAGLSLSIPISLAITGLLVIVAISYYQTIYGYPSGGGSYGVAHENLGRIPGLIAAAALLTDYILTAAVSLTAGVAAIASAFPELWPYRVWLSLGLLLVITLLNLRGLRETGTAMAVPVYFFLVTYLGMLAYGAVLLFIEGPTPLAASAPAPLLPVTTLLILHAFSTGCTALTGVEAISNGVPVFEPPESKNAGRTLIVMAILMGVLFVGSIALTQLFGLTAGPQETILSALARRILDNNPAYFVIQIATMLILAVAANTSFAGYPRLAMIMARDGYLPRQFAHLGDRLVFANGILFLSGVTAVLIVLFRGYTHALVPLFAVGVFLAFTLSQVGMVVHWRRERSPGWQARAWMNGLGAVVTAVTVVIIGVSKFLEGAWIIVLLIPILVIFFQKVYAHYQEANRQLSLQLNRLPRRPHHPPRIVVPVSNVHRGVAEALNFARTISDDITGVYVEIEPGSADDVQKQWKQLWPDIPLHVIYSPYRALVGPLLSFLDEYDQQAADGQQAAVVLPEIVPAKWWHGLLHNQTAWMIKTAMLYRRRRLGFQRVIIDVPLHLKK
jgi:amino acid transporter